jgi:hypothetical protein
MSENEHLQHAWGKRRTKMRRDKRALVAAIVTVAALAAVPVAFAGSATDAARTFASGTNTHQSAATLKNALANPTVQGYQSPTATAAMHNAVAGATAHSASGPLGASHSGGGLPYTGTDLAVFAAIAAGLIGGGLLLRRAGRRSS